MSLPAFGLWETSIEKNIAGNIQGRSHRFPPIVLKYVRGLVPGEIAVKLHEDAYQFI